VDAQKVWRKRAVSRQKIARVAVNQKSGVAVPTVCVGVIPVVTTANALSQHQVLEQQKHYPRYPRQVPTINFPEFRDVTVRRAVICCLALPMIAYAISICLVTEYVERMVGREILLLAYPAS
jgi:hypothetical protein